MIYIIVARKANPEAGALRLPLSAPIIRTEPNGVRRFLRHEPRPHLQSHPDGYSEPLLYVYESVQEVDAYDISPTAVVNERQEITKRYVVHLYFPIDSSAVALAHGPIVHASKAMKFLAEELSTNGYAAPVYRPAEFDIQRIRHDLPNDQWFRRARRTGNVESVTIYGDAIEQDLLYGAIDEGGFDNQVGVTLAVQGALLKIRVVSQGRLQFTNFRPEHLASHSSPHGDPWPLILEAVRYFRPYIL